MRLDASFDFRREVRPGQDIDKYSPTLRQYHQALWSKELPTGGVFALRDAAPAGYLAYEGGPTPMPISSDSITQSFVDFKRMSPIIAPITSERREQVLQSLRTIGGYTIFPSTRVNRLPTINGARGLNQRICDRFDLTLECIRRHYLRLKSPLDAALARYRGFFTLFGDFEGYVEFFLLQDLVSSTQDNVRFFLPFDPNFPLRPLPANLGEYDAYIEATMDFVHRRGHRMLTAIDRGLEMAQ